MSLKCGKGVATVLLIVFLSALNSGLCFAQQSLSFENPTLFDSTFNDQSEVLSPLLSPDNSTLYFVKAFHPDNIGGQYAGTDIWFSFEDSLGNWSAPSNKNSKWNNQDNNAVIGMHQDGEVVYLLNSYKKGSGISFSKKVDEKWTSPEFIAVPGIGSSSFVGFNMSKTFDVLLMSMEGNRSLGQEDLYVSLKDSTNKWSKPINLGPTINTTGYEISPYLSDDKSVLYFASDGHGGIGGCDIFMSRRLYDSWTVWSKPYNLGSNINSDRFDAYFSIYSDSISYFVSNRDSPTSRLHSSVVKKEAAVISVDDMLRIIESDVRPELRNFNSGPSLTLYFENRRYDLGTESEDEIKLFLERAMSLGNTHFHISGSGDIGIQAAANKNLSNWRIFATMTKFLDNNIKVGNITAERLKVSTANPEMYSIVRIQSFEKAVK